MKKTTPLFAVLLLLLSCGPAPQQKQKNGMTYFNLKGYFDKEILRLQSSNPGISKTVSVNDAEETRNTQIANWKKELALFSEADINRDSWKGLFAKEQKNDVLIYTSNDEKVPVKKISMIMRNQVPKAIIIVVKNDNSLYTSTDSLFYFPDSLYRIKKIQNIKLLSGKKYEITGRF